MPYIKQEYRELLDFHIDSLVDQINNNFQPEEVDGILNYTITRILTNNSQKWRYRDVNRNIGVLECAKFELYRRIGNCLEDNAVLKNGDLNEYKIWNNS